MFIIKLFILTYMVTDYLSKLSGECRYNYSKLKNVVYLVSEDHLKDVQIDNGEAYISGLTELPLRINGFNIQLQESTSLDERYKFQKTLTLSMHGYVNYKIFGGRYYAIIESEDGTFWMINVDFPSRITHTFNLSKDVNQTDFTFASLSNFPTLKLNADFEAVSPVCLGLNVHGIDTLQLIEFEKARLDTENKTVISTEDFKTIEFLGNSASFQEVYDGTKVTDTITFDIAFDNYKPSWQYNLLEFLDNRYSAIITPKGGDNKYYPGYNFGLQPSYNIQTASNNDGSDIITVTLVETSSYGTTSAVDWSDEQSTATRWRYVKKVGDIVCYECVGIGQAKYLVQQEVDAFGNPTGNYMALDGYEGVYNSKLNIVDTFDDEEIFNTNDCSEDGQCPIVTDMPTTIYFTAITCSTYSVRSDCDWSINNIPDNLTISPLSGAASSSNTTVTVCQTAPVTQSAIENSFSINAGNNVRIVNVKTQLDSGCIRPTHQSINCLNQTVTFTYDGSCNLIVQSIPSNLTYAVSNNTLTVQVPKNETTSGKTYPIIVSNCDCSSASSVIYIEQDKTYERWANDTGFICENGNSYSVQRRYTGTTSDNITGRTDTVRAGSLIQSGDTACDSFSTKYIFDNHYYCVNGDKYQALEQVISYDSGQTWVKTNKTQLGELVESASTFCQQEALYEWRLSNQWVCYDAPTPPPPIEPIYRWYESGYTCIGYDKYQNNIKQVSYDSGTTWENVSPEEYSATTLIEQNSEYCGYIPPTPTFDGKFKATYTGGTTYSAECDSSETSLTSGNTRPNGYTYTAMTDAVIGDCVTAITTNAFSGCSNLTSVAIPNSVKSIGLKAFYYCTSLTSVTIPNSVIDIGESAFESCYNLTSVAIPSGVTSISDYAFQVCSGLTSVTIPDSVTSIGTYAFSDCESLPSITIPSSVTTLKDYAFYYCTSLTSVTIPSSVTNIKHYAFMNCSSLTSITINATAPPRIGNMVFSNTNNCPIYVPAERVEEYKDIWSEYASRIQAIPNS